MSLNKNLSRKTEYLILLGILLVVIYTGIIAPLFSIKYAKMEGFLTPGKYPVSVDKPLLFNDYLVNKNPGASKINSTQQYVDYPIFSASSCGTNNLKYWRRPTNGQCSRADMCGGLYMNTKQKIPAQPVFPKWGAGQRVNFYDTCMFNDRS